MPSNFESSSTFRAVLHTETSPGNGNTIRMAVRLNPMARLSSYLWADASPAEAIAPSPADKAWRSRSAFAHFERSAIPASQLFSKIKTARRNIVNSGVDAERFFFHS